MCSASITQAYMLLIEARRACFSSYRSEEHTSELQSLTNLVCRLLLEKKKNKKKFMISKQTTRKNKVSIIVISHDYTYSKPSHKTLAVIQKTHNNCIVLEHYNDHTTLTI